MVKECSRCDGLGSCYIRLGGTWVACPNCKGTGHVKTVEDKSDDR